MRQPSKTLQLLAAVGMLIASFPATSEACLFYPCGIFGWRCRNYGYPPSFGAPPTVPTSQAVYPPVYAAPAYTPAPVYAPRPCPQPCPQPCPTPRCVPVCPPACPPVCQPVCQPCPTVCPSVCPSSCGPVYSGSINCQYGPRYAPVTAYRRELYSIPVTSYRTVPIYNPRYGLTTTYRPVTTFYRQVQNAPYNTYRVVNPGYAPGYGGAPMTAPRGGCSTCGAAAGSVPTAQPTPMLAPVLKPEVEKSLAVGPLPGVTPPAHREHERARPQPEARPAAPPAAPAATPRGRLPVYAPGETPEGPSFPEGTPRTTLRGDYDPSWSAQALRPTGKVRPAAWSEEGPVVVTPAVAAPTPVVTPETKPATTVKQIDGEEVDFGGWRPAGK